MSHLDINPYEICESLIFRTGSTQSLAEDFEIDGDAFIVSTDPSDIMSVRDNLENSGYEIESANVDLVPKNLQNVDSDKENSVITLLEALEDHDDIKAVYTNFDSED